MEIDFLQEFGGYSTAALLAVVREPGNYQPAAIAAAEELLKGRDVSASDELEAGGILDQEAATREARAAPINALKDKAKEVVEPLVGPDRRFDPAKWYRLFLIVYGVFYVYVLYKVLKKQLVFLDCKGCIEGFLPMGGVINALFMTVNFACFIKNKRWGWMLFAASTISQLVTMISQAQILYKYRRVMSASPGMLFTEFILPIMIVVFLWRRDIRVFFGISDRDKRRTAWAGIGIGMLYLLVVELWVI